MGVVLGLVNDDFHTDLFNRQGSYLSAGTPQVRSFIEHDYSLYVGDTYRVTRDLTLNVGVRWENFRPPYEAHGLQVASTVPLTQYFAERNRAAEAGRAAECHAQCHAAMGAEWTRQWQADLVESRQP